jgi:hypothetical protein
MQTRIINDGQYNRQANGKCKPNEIGIEKVFGMDVGGKVFQE